MTITTANPAVTPATAAEDAEERRRAGYVAGLRALADKLEGHPEVPLPFDGRVDPVTIHFLAGDDPRAALVATARAIGISSWQKETRDYGPGGAYFDLTGTMHGLRVRLTADRAAVCERVVTGTEDVTERVPDPEKLAAVPMIEVTRPVETVEWRCHPVLAPPAGGGAT